MNIDLTTLFEKQASLDSLIHQQHNVNYENTYSRRLLALLVELGELANETRAFKFWSIKPSSPKEKILDEYADGMHFFMSLGLIVKSEKRKYKLSAQKIGLVEQFLNVYHLIDNFSQKPKNDTFEIAFESFLNLGLSLASSPEELVDAYLKKLDINYNRQQNNY